MQLSLFCLDFFPFGEGVGDTLGPREDDESFGPIHLSVPVVYFDQPQTSIYVSYSSVVYLQQVQSPDNSQVGSNFVLWGHYGGGISCCILVW